MTAFIPCYLIRQDFDHEGDPIGEATKLEWKDLPATVQILIMKSGVQAVEVHLDDDTSYEFRWTLEAVDD